MRPIRLGSVWLGLSVAIWLTAFLVPNLSVAQFNGCPPGFCNGSTGPYIGAVATRGHSPSDAGSPNTQFQTRTFHIARTNISTAQLVLSNAAGTDSVVNAGASATFTASIEYPSGTFNQAKFSGATSALVGNPSFVVTDAIVLSVPIPSGATFWVRVHYASSGTGILYTQYANTNAANDAMTFGTSVADQTMGGTVTATQANFTYFPTAILGLTSISSPCLIGDSRVSGTGETSSGSTSDVGELARSVGPVYGYMNLGTPGLSTTSIIAAHTNLVTLSQYCSHLINNASINDTASAGSVILANNTTIRGYFPSSKPFFLTTIAPQTTSTDAWATLANQTPAAGNTNRVNYNTLLRGATPPGFRGVFDTANVVESSLNSGKWIVTGAANYATADGTHETTTSYGLIQSSGVVNTNLLRLNFLIERDITPAANENNTPAFLARVG